MPTSIVQVMYHKMYWLTFKVDVRQYHYSRFNRQMLFEWRMNKFSIHILCNWITLQESDVCSLLGVIIFAIVTKEKKTNFKCFGHNSFKFLIKSMKAY